jgi:hypothetical protein
MITLADPNSIPEATLLDLEAVAAAVFSGRRPDPELARRVRERAQRSTEAIRRRSGELNIATDLIRQGRVEE